MGRSAGLGVSAWGTRRKGGAQERKGVIAFVAGGPKRSLQDPSAASLVTANPISTNRHERSTPMPQGNRSNSRSPRQLDKRRLGGQNAKGGRREVVVVKTAGSTKSGKDQRRLRCSTASRRRMGSKQQEMVVSETEGRRTDGQKLQSRGGKRGGVWPGLGT